MKKVKSLLLITGMVMLCYGLQSCCKMNCGEPSLLVSFERFTVTEADTILLTAYQPASGFTEKTDSQFVYLRKPDNDTVKASVIVSLKPDKNWRVDLKSVQKQYSISNIQLKTVDCPCGGSKGKEISAYWVNNIQKQGNLAILEPW